MAFVLLALCSAALCGEAIFLQNGEEYLGRVERIVAGQLHALIGGQPQAFPLGEVHRIEFQRRRPFDDVAKAADLAARAPLFAEALKPTTDELRHRFPQAGVVVLADETVLSVRAGGEWELKRTEAWRILEDRGADTAMRNFTFFPDRQQAEVIFAITVAPDGAVSHLADTAMKDEALHSRLPAYNFQHRLRFTLKGAVPGATLIVAAALRGRASLLLPAVLDRRFWDEDPALRRSVRLVADEKAKGLVAIATANGPKDWGKDNLWEVKDAAQVFREPMMPPMKAFSPRLLLACPKASWAEVAKALFERAGGPVALPTKGVPPRALYDQVRQAIRLESVPLEALPDGPAPPAAVLARGYGTEVERALLLAALLRGAGLQADVVLARCRKDGPLLGSVPRAVGFSEGLVRLTEPGGKITWLQPDSEDRGFGELAPEAQGGEGLDLASGQLVAVPTSPPAAEAQVRSVEVELAESGDAVVRDRYRLWGHTAAGYRKLKDLTQDQLQKWAAREASGEATGVDLLEFKHSDFGNANTEERLDFTYRMPALAEKAGNFLLLRLPNASESATEVGRSTREHALFWDAPEREETTFLIKAPPGYAVYALGQKLDKKGDGWSLTAEWAGTGPGATGVGGTGVGGTGVPPVAPATVRLHEVWQRSALSAPKEAYSSYRDARIARSRLRGEVIVFVKE